MDTIKNKAEKLGIDEPNRVYVVQSSHGQYEDHITEINGIYSRPDVAEIEAQKIRDYYKEILDGGYPSDKVDDWDVISKEEKERILGIRFNDNTKFAGLNGLDQLDLGFGARYELDNLYYCSIEYNHTWVTEFEVDK